MKAKTFTLAFIFLTLSGMLRAQTPVFDWAVSMGGLSDDFPVAGSVDAAGNIYTTGLFFDTADFDPGAGINNLIPEDNISPNAFVSKVSTSGSMVWTNKIFFRPTAIFNVTNIQTDDSMNVYVSGSFGADTLYFGSGPGVPHIETMGIDGFIVKYSSSGNFVWAISVVPSGGEPGAIHLAIDKSGFIYVSLDWFDSFNMIPGLDFNKYDASGNFVWTKQVSGGFLGVDGAGNVYCSNGTEKIDSSGNPIWNLLLGGNVISFCADDSGNVYSSGYFTGMVDFDPGAGMANLTSAGQEDIFVCKLDSSGNFKWASQMGGAGDERATSMAIGKDGSVYTKGTFTSPADFDPGLGIQNLSSGINFISKLDVNGNYGWAIAIDIDGTSLGVDSNDNVYVSGSFSSIEDFDFSSDTTNLTPAGSTDIFIYKINQQLCSSTSSTITQNGCDSITINSQTYFTTGQYFQTLTNAAGCDSIITLDLIVDTVDLSVSTVGTTLTSLAASASYQWIDCDNGGTIIPGEINQSYSNSLGGNFAVIVTQNGCTDTSACYNIIGVGINQLVKAGSLDVYPNPASQFVNISSPFISKQAHVRMVDLAGKNIAVFSEQKGSVLTIDVSALAKGAYYIELIQEGSIYRTRFMRN